MHNQQTNHFKILFLLILFFSILSQQASPAAPIPQNDGLNNLGSTCFMNASLQPLFHNKSLVEKLLSKKPQDTVAQKNTNLEKTLKAYLELNQEQTTKKQTISPKPFHDAMWNFAVQTNRLQEADGEKYAHHDAAEFINLMLEIFTSNNPTISPDIKELFEWELSVISTCLRCNTQTEEKGLFKQLDLPIPEQVKNPSLDDCLQQFFKEEEIKDYRCKICGAEEAKNQLAGDTLGNVAKRLGFVKYNGTANVQEVVTKLNRPDYNKLISPNINKNYPSDENFKLSADEIKVMLSTIYGALTGKRKTTLISKLPKIFIIIFKRFKQDPIPHKLETIISFPERLNVHKFINQAALRKESAFKLFAVTRHFGGLAGGHYNAIVYDYNSKTWYEFDDSNLASKTSYAATQNSPSPYILFYEQVAPEGEDKEEKVLPAAGQGGADAGPQPGLKNPELKVDAPPSPKGPHAKPHAIGAGAPTVPFLETLQKKPHTLRDHVAKLKQKLGDIVVKLRALSGSLKKIPAAPAAAPSGHGAGADAPPPKAPEEEEEKGSLADQQLEAKIKEDIKKTTDSFSTKGYINEVIPNFTNALTTFVNKKEHVTQQDVNEAMAKISEDAINLAFPFLALHGKINPKELLKKILEQYQIYRVLWKKVDDAPGRYHYEETDQTKQRQLVWCAPCPHLESEADRFILILYQLNDILQAFPPKENTKENPFVHTEFGEDGCLQTYLLTVGLLELGYTHITLHLIGGPDSQLFAVNKKSNLECASKMYLTLEAYKNNNIKTKSDITIRSFLDTYYKVNNAFSQRLKSPKRTAEESSNKEISYNQHLAYWRGIYDEEVDKTLQKIPKSNSISMVDQAPDATDAMRSQFMECALYGSNEPICYTLTHKAGKKGGLVKYYALHEKLYDNLREQVSRSNAT